MILQLADSLGQVQDRTERAELATKIFGGSGLAMVNVLKQGSAAIMEQRREARELGIVLSTETARSSEVFINSWTRVQGAISGIKNLVGAELIPEVTAYMDMFRDWVMLNREWLKSNIMKTLRSMISGFKLLIPVVRNIHKAISGLIQSMGGLETVIKAVLTAMTIFTAMKFISGIGNLTMAIAGGLVTAFRTLGNAALMAQVKMAAIPLAIGAAVVAVLLILEDLYAFFDGRDSLFGLLMEKFEGYDFGQIIRSLLDKGLAVFAEYSEKFKTYLADLFTFDNVEGLFSDIAKGMLSAIQGEFSEGIGPWLKEFITNTLAGNNLVGKIIDFSVQVFKTIGDTLLITIGALIDNAWKMVKGTFSGVFDFFGFGGDEDEEKQQKGKTVLGNLKEMGVGSTMQSPALAAAGAGGEVGSMTQITNNNSVNVPVTIPAGTPPEEGQRMVADGVRDALEQLARETQAATNSNVER
jgi:hypothetical protein